jgi:hypothetical protein
MLCGLYISAAGVVLHIDSGLPLARDARPMKAPHHSPNDGSHIEKDQGIVSEFGNGRARYSRHQTAPVTRRFCRPRLIRPLSRRSLRWAFDAGSINRAMQFAAARIGRPPRAKKSVHDFRFCEKLRLGHGSHVADSRESAISRFADCALQMPSLAFSSAFTACGLALPPVAFIA